MPNPGLKDGNPFVAKKEIRKVIKRFKAEARRCLNEAGRGEVIGRYHDAEDHKHDAMCHATYDAIHWCIGELEQVVQITQIHDPSNP